MNRQKAAINNKNTKLVDEFSETVVETRRVSKKTQGGNRLRFSALVVVGDGKGRVGASQRKAPDVVSAIHKAMRSARENLVEFPVVGEASTIPHEVELKEGAAHVLLRPAPPGTGIRAGGPMRAVLEVGGVQNVVGKIIGTKNKRANVVATIKALGKLKAFEKRIAKV